MLWEVVGSTDPVARLVTVEGMSGGKTSEARLFRGTLGWVLIIGGLFGFSVVLGMVDSGHLVLIHGNIALVALSLFLRGSWATPLVALGASALFWFNLYIADATTSRELISSDVYLGLVLIWVVAGLVQYLKRSALKRERDVAQARIRQAAVVSLATDPVIVAGDIGAAASRAAEVLAHHLTVARASIWALSEDRTELRCLNLFEALESRHSTGMVLRATDYPRYFAALETGRAIDAHDARTDPRTSEYTNGYLIPLGITSMLDAGIRVGGRNFGVVCCEHIGPAREWGSDELAFAGEVADQLAQAVANSETRRAHDAVLANERRYRDLVETSNDLIWSLDRDWRWTFVNRTAAERIFGYSPEELLGRSIFDFQDASAAARDRAALKRTLAGEALFLHETQFRRKDGSTVLLSLNAVAFGDDSGAAIGVRGIGTDITARVEAEAQRRLLEEQLMKAQKMEALGRLAGGVAHDFNNLLTAILMNADALRSSMPAGAAGLVSAEAIAQAAQRGKGLVSQILTFSRQVKPSKDPVRLDGIVREVEQLIRVSLPDSIALDVLSEGDVVILGDAGQMSQVIMNLCSNAIYAMRERGGTLRLETRRLSAGEVSTTKLGKISSLDVVMLRVSDTGAGMSAATREKIFEPFFSTKPVGEGTGLGLSVVLGIVEAHGGHSVVESEIGVGTTFEIYFPAAEAHVTFPDPSPTQPTNPLRGNEHVIIVDDEPLVLDVAKASLEHFGYHVTAYLSAEDLLGAVAEGRFRGDILITDQTMPRISGLELAQKVAAVVPHLPIVLCSGYDLNGEHADIPEDLVSAHVPKPYSIVDLLKVVRPLLDRRER